MLSRLRFLSGLIGLLAATLFVAEGIATAHCAPPRLHGTRTASAAAEIAEAEAPVEASAPSPAMDCCDRVGDDGPSEGACPFSAVASPGSCLSVAVPTPSSPTLGAPLPTRTSPPEARRGRDLLRAIPLFRPPRT